MSKDFDFIVDEKALKRQMAKRSKSKRAKSGRTRKTKERRDNVYKEEFYVSPYECWHAHHMQCVRCGLVQFSIGMVTGITAALFIAKVIFT